VLAYLLGEFAVKLRKGQDLVRVEAVKPTGLEGSERTLDLAFCGAVANGGVNENRADAAADERKL
jgi:hypothetical protein